LNYGKQLPNLVEFLIKFISATIGLAAGIYIAPYMTAFATKKFVFGSGLSFGMTGGAMVTFGGLVISGSQVLAGMTTLGLLTAAGLVRFAKGHGPRMGHNQHENRQFKQAMNKLGIKKTDPRWREAHEALQGEAPITEFRELLEFIKDILGIF